MPKPGKLNYAIPNQPATVHDLLLQKSSGEFDLIIWDERLNGSDKVTVHFGGAYPSVKIYDPTISATVIETRKKINSLPLTLSDHPVIIALPSHSVGIAR